MRGRWGIRAFLFPILMLAPACRSPLRDLKAREDGPQAVWIAAVQVEDHSRTLKRIRDIQPGEANTAAARRAALESHRRGFEEALERRVRANALRLEPEAPYRLDLTITTLGEVRAKYIAYGILSGVAWGVVTGLLTHNPELALALGLYELVEETLFWVAGSSLFGRFSAPVVVEARMQEVGRPKPLWSETYFSIWGGKHLKAYAEADRKRRELQLQASLEGILDELFADLRKASALRLPPEGVGGLVVLHGHP